MCITAFTIGRLHSAVVCLLLAVVCLSAAAVAAGGAPQEGIAATCVGIDGALLQQTKDGFKSVKVGDGVPDRTLLVGLPEAVLVSSDKKVKIGLLLYMGDLLPVTEAAVILHENREVDAEITIDRGVVRLEPTPSNDNVRVKLHAGKQTWDVTMKDPDAAALAIRFGRHEPGTKLFSKAAKKGQASEPLMHLGLLVLKGRVVVNTGSSTFALNGPPGPALIKWDTNGGYDVQHMDKLPEEVRKLDVAEMKHYKEVCAVTAKLAAGELGKGLDQLVGSTNPVERRVAVAVMGAVDDVPRLWSALENPKHEDVRDQAVLTLRNWIGRHKNQLPDVHEHLIKVKKYNAVQARTMEQLLKGFDDQDRKEPLVYQLLIGALEHGPMPIRQLAHWHLERLAPAGQKIAYDAAADEAARHKTVLQWRELIPEGKLPPPIKKDK